MSELILTLPNLPAGDIARDSVISRGEQRGDYRYIESLNDRLRGSLASEFLPRLPLTFHLLYAQDGREQAIADDLMKLHNEPEARDDERGLIFAVEPNWNLSLCALPDGQPATQPDHSAYLAQLGIARAQGKNNLGALGHIAVIDTGAEGVKIDDYYDLLSAPLRPGVQNAIDDFGHGTAIATLIREVAPDCKLSMIRVTDDDDIPLWYFMAGLGLAVLDAQAEIINLSLGIENMTGKCRWCGVSAYARAFALENFMRFLKMGAKWFTGKEPPTFVAATGNDGSQNGFFIPARWDVCLAVGSVNKSGHHSEFSTYGTLTHPYYVVAPGGETVNSVTTEFAIADNKKPHLGTSISTAYASGVLALLRTDHPTGDLTQLALQRVTSASPPLLCGQGQIQYS